MTETRICVFKPETMVLRVECLLQVGGKFLPQIKKIYYLGPLILSDVRMEVDQCSLLVDAWVSQGENGPDLKGKLSISPIDLHFHPHLWPQERIMFTVTSD